MWSSCPWRLCRSWRPSSPFAGFYLFLSGLRLWNWTQEDAAGSMTRPNLVLKATATYWIIGIWKFGCLDYWIIGFRGFAGFTGFKEWELCQVWRWPRVIGKRFGIRIRRIWRIWIWGNWELEEWRFEIWEVEVWSPTEPNLFFQIISDMPDLKYIRIKCQRATMGDEKLMVLKKMILQDHYNG